MVAYGDDDGRTGRISSKYSPWNLEAQECANHGHKNVQLQGKPIKCDEAMSSLALIDSLGDWIKLGGRSMDEDWAGGMRAN